MQQLEGMNPWLSMWSQPRATVRALVNSCPTYGVYYLAPIFALENLFFLANWWSLGIQTPFYSILLVCLIFSPFLGLLWLYFSGWVFHFTGRILKGSATQLQLRTAICWSKIPSVITVLMWFILLCANPEDAFIQDVGGGPSLLFVTFINFILSSWSFVLLIQGVREVQGFSVIRSLLNVLFAWFVTSFFFVLFSVFLRILTT